MSIKISPQTFLLISLIVFLACERDWNNPWDEFNDLSPEAWAPQNLQIEEVSITAKKLTWTLGDYNIEGFILDRKKGDEPWQVAYQSFAKETRNWSDTEIVPDPSLTYEYRVYAFAGRYLSNQKALTTSAAIPPPEELFITAGNFTSITLTWNYYLSGHDGFKIDRMENNGLWDEEYLTINSSQNGFTDINVDLRTKIYYYRLCVFYDEFESIKIVDSVRLKIGMVIEGGIIFHIESNGHGMICAENDQSTSSQWGCYDEPIGSTGSEVGTGSTNTDYIILNCNDNDIAARTCYNLVLKGYNDWFLPSRDELDLMYQNLKANSIGGFSDNSYWSSTILYSQQTWYQQFSNGMQYTTSNAFHHYGIHVRAARSF